MKFSYFYIAHSWINEISLFFAFLFWLTRDRQQQRQTLITFDVFGLYMYIYIIM